MAAGYFFVWFPWEHYETGVYACPTCGRSWSQQVRKVNEIKETLTETERYIRAIQAEIDKSDKHLLNFLEFGEIVKAGILQAEINGLELAILAIHKIGNS